MFFFFLITAQRKVLMTLYITSIAYRECAAVLFSLQHAPCSLLHLLILFARNRVGDLMENVVCLECERRGDLNGKWNDFNLCKK